MRWKLAIAILFVASQAQAQVFRCPDRATGKITYSDSPCSDGAQIVRQRSADEMALDGERAALARERLALERERQQMREQSQTYAAPPAMAEPSRSTSRECEIAQKNAWGVNRAQAQRKADLACLGPEGAARVQAERERRRPVVTNCFRNGAWTNCVSR